MTQQEIGASSPGAGLDAYPDEWLLRVELLDAGALAGPSRMHP